MATASDIPEDEMQKMMTSVEEIIWSKQTYTVQDIYERCSFPVLARVEDSFLGDHSTDSYSTGEILWINGGIEQKRVIMESRKGECLSIPISKNFKIRKANREYEKYQPLSETLVESEMGEWNEICDTTLYKRNNDHLWNKLGGYNFKYMRIIGKHSMTFLTAYCLCNEMSILDCPASVIKHHHQQTFVLGIGLNAQTFIKWTQFCHELASFLNTSINHDDPTLPGITLYSKQFTNREHQSMQLLSTEEDEIRNAKAGTNSSEDQGDKSSCGKTDTPSKTVTIKAAEKERKKSRTLSLLRRQPSDITSEKAKKKSWKLIPQVKKQGKKSKEGKYGKLLLSSEEAPRYETHVRVPENSCYIDLDKPQEQSADNISYCSQSDLISSAIYPSSNQSDSSIHNQPNLSKTPISTPKYYERELPTIPPSNVVVSSSNSYDVVPSSISYNEIPASIPECEYDEIDPSIMKGLEKLKINDGPICKKEDLPQDLKMLTLDQVQDCLHLLHLERLLDTFKENDIDGVILCDLSKDILIDDLGLTRIEALKLRKFIDQKWLPNSS